MTARRGHGIIEEEPRCLLQPLAAIGASQCLAAGGGRRGAVSSAAAPLAGRCVSRPGNGIAARRAKGDRLRWRESSCRLPQSRRLRETRRDSPLGEGANTKPPFRKREVPQRGGGIDPSFCRPSVLPVGAAISRPAVRTYNLQPRPDGHAKRPPRVIANR